MLNHYPYYRFNDTHHLPSLVLVAGALPIHLSHFRHVNVNFNDTTGHIAFECVWYNTANRHVHMMSFKICADDGQAAQDDKQAVRDDMQ